MYWGFYHIQKKSNYTFIALIQYTQNKFSHKILFIHSEFSHPQNDAINGRLFKKNAIFVNSANCSSGF